MDNEQLKTALNELKTTVLGEIETKGKDAAKTVFDAGILEFEKKAKGMFAEEIKTLKAELEDEFKAKIKVVQDHADKLDQKLQKKGGEKDEKKDFFHVLQHELTEKTDDFEKFKRKEIKSLSIELKAVGDMSTANVTGGNRYGQVMAPGIIEQPKRKVHVEDLLPGGEVGPGNSFTFMREKGQGEGGFAGHTEGQTKSQIDLDLEEASVQIETIAGFLRITRKAMANIPGMISFLMSRLPEKFAREKDRQFLYGSGTSPELKGLLTTGNFVPSNVPAATVLIEKIIRDMARLEDTYERTATGILVRPVQGKEFYLNKASGSGEFDLPQGVTFVNGQLYILGVPVVETTALNTNDYVVGDFEMGAQILTQEGMRIEFFEQDGTNVRENKVTVRVEGNYALPVYGGDYFIKGSAALT